MNTIIIELCAEDRARLDKIIEGLAHRPNCDSCVQSALKWPEIVKKDKPAPTTTAQEPVEATESESRPEAPAVEETPTEPTEEAEAPVITIELTDLQNKVVELARKGLKDQVRDVVKAYGVERVSQIPEDKRAELMTKLNALEG